VYGALFHRTRRGTSDESYTAACGKINHKTRKIICPDVVFRKILMDWVRGQDADLRGAGTNENRRTYKCLPEVFKHHGATVCILHRLKPMGVAMAGKNEFDPYKARPNGTRNMVFYDLCYAFCSGTPPKGVFQCNSNVLNAPCPLR
jgi:hypothetical protein